MLNEILDFVQGKGIKTSTSIGTLLESLEEAGETELVQDVEQARWVPEVHRMKFEEEAIRFWIWVNKRLKKLTSL